jgi:hypothetical protein
MMSEPIRNSILGFVRPASASVTLSRINPNTTPDRYYTEHQLPEPKCSKQVCVRPLLDVIAFPESGLMFASDALPL